MKKSISIILVVCLLFINFNYVEATTVKEAEDKAEQLEDEKKELEKEKNSLASNVEKLAKEMLEVQEEIAEVYVIIEDTEVELALALTTKQNQYDDMKTRIRYMYENTNNNDLFEMFFNVSSINDLLNKIEYAEQVTAYDRRKLEDFQSAVLEIEEKQAELEKENNRLVALQSEVAKKKTEVELMLAEAEVTLDKLDDEIGDNAKILAALVKAAEEEAKKAEEAAQAGSSGSSSSGSAGGSVVSGNGMFTHPIPGYNYLSSGFGYRIHPITGAYKLHAGTDFAASTGTAVYAAMGGTVTVSTYSSSAGNYISINHGNGLVTIYMHNSQLFVSVGDTVTKGQNIALSGNTGSSTGPHLHFQVMLNGTAVEPMNYL